LTEEVEPRLMDKGRAKQVFDELHERIKPTRSIPMNKQKGEMVKPSYLTGIVNMLIEENREKLPSAAVTTESHPRSRNKSFQGILLFEYLIKQLAATSFSTASIV
jgi:hypothetical protein